jgi:hypothetical protein
MRVVFVLAAELTENKLGWSSSSKVCLLGRAGPVIFASQTKCYIVEFLRIVP